MIHHVSRATRHLIFWSLILIALGMSGLRLFLSKADSYKSQLSERVSEYVGTPVTIGHIRARMRGFSPELVLSDIDVSPQFSSAKSDIELKEIRLGLDLLDTLISGDPMSTSWVTLVGVKLSIIRKPDGSFAIAGLKSSDEQPLWLLEGRKYEVLQSQVEWHDEKNQRPPVTFSNVDLAIINDEQNHKINFLTKLPESIGDQLRISMDLKGNIFEPSAMHGLVFAEGKGIKPAEWLNSELPLNLSVDSGFGNFKIWSTWQNSLPIAVQGSANFQPLKLRRPGQTALTIDQLEADFKLTKSDLPVDENSWQLAVNHFLLESSENNKPSVKKQLSGGFYIQTQFKDEVLLPKAGVFIERMDLQEAARLVRFFAPPENEQIKLIKQSRLQGELHNFSMFTDWTQKIVAVNGKFVQLGIATNPSTTAVEHLTGVVKGTEKSGVIRLASKDVQLTASDLFRSSVLFSKLNGALDWQQTDTEWQLAANNLALESADIKTRSQLQLSIPKNDEKAYLDVQSAFTGNDVGKIKHYLPAKIMKKSLLNWLDHAFVKGRLNEGKLLFQGRPADFPFTSGEGVFEAMFDMDQLDLNFNPDWPNLTGVKANVLFFQNELQVNLTDGRSGQVKINQAEVTIPDLAESQYLQVQGSLDSGLAETLDYLQRTPLQARVTPVLNALDPNGKSRIDLAMELPLAEGLPYKILGAAQLNNAKLTIKMPDLIITHLQGQLKFNEQGVFSDIIRGSAFAHPIQIKIDNAEQQTLVNVSGLAGVNDLQRQFGLPLSKVASGEAKYSVQFKMPFHETFENGKQTPTLTVTSSLVGIDLDLPGDLAKTQSQNMPLSLTFQLVDSENPMPIDLNYADKLKAALKLNVKEPGLFSGHVLIGDGTALQRREAGLKLEINRKPLALTELFNLTVQNNKNPSPFDIRELKISSKQAFWNQTPLGAFELALMQKNNQWRGTIDSVFASGKITLPMAVNASSPIDLNMKFLDLSAIKRLKFPANDAESNFSPESLPLMNITSQKILWKSIDLGNLVLETEHVPEGIHFKRIDLNGTDDSLNATGDWLQKDKQSATHLEGRGKIARAGELFAQLGITHDLAETTANFDFTVDWHAAPYQASIAALTGQLNFTLKNGRILSIEPGFGRILGVLAMAQWLKRLQLDFSDIYEEGLSFNSIKGRFDFNGGKAVTNNLVVDAVPAKITITGSTDLISRTVDHMVNVTPKSADAVPIAGTIVGKVANLIAKSLTGQNQEGFLFGSQYLVKGPWTNTQITPLHEHDGLLQKTWNGITAFPWLDQQNNK